MTITASTLVELFANRVAQSGSSEAVRYRRGGRIVIIDWNTLANDVGRSAAALAALGLQPGDRVVQVSENCYEWLVLDLAIQTARAIHVPLHASLSDAQLAFQIADCGARLVAVSTAAKLKQLASQSYPSPSGIQWLLYDAPQAKGRRLPAFHVWSQLVADSDATAAGQMLDDARREVRPSDLATILYTSGTTGAPKGVMLTQANLTSNVLNLLNVTSHRQDDLRLCILPWSHILARTCDLYTWMGSGCRMAISESRDTIMSDLVAFQPTLLNAVPYFFEKVHRGLVSQGTDQTAGSLQRLLGGCIRMCGCGGAALPAYAADLFAFHSIPILQGYGLTETSPVVTMNTEAAHRAGTVGRSLPGVDVRIADDGEVLTRGPHVMQGYYHNQQATDEVIRDGWFHTGDLGQLDGDGFLSITGRKKEMIVLSTGRNVSPVNIELRLTSLPIVLQAIVIGNDRPHLTALIVPNPDVLRLELKNRRIRVFSKKGAVKHPRVVAMYREAIDDCLNQLASYEQIGDFRVLDHGFTLENGGLTPTLKLRRDVIHRQHADAIASMYSG